MCNQKFVNNCSFTANPITQRLILPRLPLSVLLRGNFQMFAEDSRLLDGTEVPPNSLPFQVSVQRRGLSADSAYIHLCGGSILDDHVILNVVHCLQG